MIDFRVDENSRLQMGAFLNSLSPRLIAEAHRSLKTVLYAGVQTGVQKYFAGSGPKGGPTSSLLTSRSGALVSSLLASADMDPDPPGSGSTQFTLSIGSALPYARIQEYGGDAGRAGPFKKKDGHRPYLPARPYLAPMLADLEAPLREALREAVAAAVKSQ